MCFVKQNLNLSIGYHNIEGLHNKTFQCKLPYLKKKLIYDIEILSETWGECNHDKTHDNFDCHEIKSQKHVDIKKGRKSGGFLIYIKKHISKAVHIIKTIATYIWLQLDKNIFHNLTENLKLCVLYLPPASSSYYNRDIFDDLAVDLMTYVTKNQPTLLLGDFNGRTGNLLDYIEVDNHDSTLFTRDTPMQKRNNCDIETNAQGKKLIDFCKSFDLQILNGRHQGDPWGNFTHYNKNKGASAVDMAIVSDNLAKEIKNFHVLPQLEISDHCKIVIQVDNMKRATQKISNTYDWKELPNSFNWDSNSTKEFKKAFDSEEVKTVIYDCKQVLEAGLIESTAKKIQEIFITAAKKALKQNKKKQTNETKYKTKKRKKWFDADCHKLKQKTRNLSCNKHNNPLNSNLRNEHADTLKQYKKLCNKKKYDFEKKEIFKLNEAADNPKSFWDAWKNIGETQNDDPIDLMKMDGYKWENYYKTLYKGPPQDPKASISASTNLILDKEFTIVDLTETIDNLKNKKASGYDRITNEFIKAAPLSVQLIILEFVNKMWNNSLAPNAWCINLITPIHKEGPKHDPENYRGLSIMNTLLKLVCTMMCHRLQKYLTENMVLAPEQIGFKQKSRTSDHIFTIKALVNKYVSDKKGKKLYACFVDFRKAFDSVPQNLLYEKLKNTNINGKFLSFLKDIYKKTKCAVKLNRHRTDFFDYTKGLRQGDPLSPLLFNIYINDVFKQINAANPTPVTLDGNYLFSGLGYADDLVIFSTTHEGLQKSIDALHAYCGQHKLEINLKKTKCMTFTKGNKIEKGSIRINGKQIENVKVFKYLGITIQKKNCSFLPTLKDLSNKANRTLFALNSKIKFTQLPVKIAIRIFDAVVSPILLYGSEVWEPYINFDNSKWESSDIERVHTQFIKRLLGLNRSTTNILARSEVGKFPLQSQIIERNINYLKYVNSKHNELVKQALTYEQTKTGTRVTMENSLSKVINDLTPVLNNQPILDIPKYKLRKTLFELQQNKWLTNIHASSKADTFKTFKTRSKFETYLCDVSNRKHRVAMTKFRTSDHRLMIEQGRRTRPRKERHERTCPHCSTTIEDECHFLTNCSMYKNRDEIFSKLEQLNPCLINMNNGIRFQFLLSQEDTETNKILAATIHEWFNTRDLFTQNNP